MSTIRTLIAYSPLGYAFSRWVAARRNARGIPTRAHWVRDEIAGNHRWRGI